MELYDYIFDKVTEQNPHQTPGSHIELTGKLYLARSQRHRSRPASISPGAEAVMTDPSINIDLAAAAAGSHEEPKTSVAHVEITEKAEESEQKSSSIREASFTALIICFAAMVLWVTDRSAATALFDLSLKA